MDKIQQDFEVWAQEVGLKTKLRNDHASDDTYFYYETEQRWKVWQAARTTPASAVPDYVLMPRRLTAENGAKSLMLGEFKESIDVPCMECCDQDDNYACETCENYGTVARDVPVGWDTIKRIYALAVEHLAKAPSPASDVSAAITDDTREKLRDAIAAALGEAMDCTRVWSAWSYGTMGPDDFSVVANDDDRLEEIVDAAIAVFAAPVAQADGEGGHG